MNANGSVQTRLTNDPGRDGTPVWSPDGSQIAFDSRRDGNAEVYVMNADGSAQTNLTNHPNTDIVPDWQPFGVGGMAELPEVAGEALETPDSSVSNTGLLASVAGAVAAAILALGGAAWYARRRWAK